MGKGRGKGKEESQVPQSRQLSSRCIISTALSLRRILRKETQYNFRGLWCFGFAECQPNLQLGLPDHSTSQHARSFHNELIFMYRPGENTSMVAASTGFRPYHPRRHNPGWKAQCQLPEDHQHGFAWWSHPRSERTAVCRLSHGRARYQQRAQKVFIFFLSFGFYLAKEYHGNLADFIKYMALLSAQVILGSGKSILARGSIQVLYVCSVWVREKAVLVRKFDARQGIICS